MNKEALIKNKIDFIENTIKNLKKKNGRKKGFYTVGSCFSFGLGLTFALTNPLIGLAAITPAALFYLARKDSEEATNILVENLEKEKKHLETVKNKEPNSSQELNKKRRKKITELKKAKESVSKKKNNHGIAATFFGITAAAGSVLTVSSIWGICSIAVGIVCLKQSLEDAMKERKKEAKLETRINNLQNDLDIINATKKSTKNGKKIQVENSKAETTNKNKVNIDNKSFIPKQVVYDDTLDKNVEAINKYIDDLENQRAVEKTKSMVKH